MSIPNTVIDYLMPKVHSPKTNKFQVLGDLDGDCMASDADFQEANDFVLQIYGYSDGEVQGNLDQPGSSKSQGNFDLSEDNAEGDSPTVAVSS